MEPLSSIRRISVDRFGEPTTGTASAPLQVSFSSNIAENRVEWTLADVTTFVVTNSGTGSRLHFANAMTGAKIADVSQFPRVHDAAMSPTGELVAFQVPTAPTDANSGNYFGIDIVGTVNSTTVPSGTFLPIGALALRHSPLSNPPAPAPPAFAVQQRDQVPDDVNTPVGDGIVFNALTFYTNNPGQTLMFAVGSRGNNQTSFNTALVDPISGNVLGIGPPARTLAISSIASIQRMVPSSMPMAETIGKALNELMALLVKTSRLTTPVRIRLSSADSYQWKYHGLS